MSNLSKGFGEAIRNRRIQLCLSQEDLGFRAGLHRTYISQIERGLKSPSLKVVSVLAKALETKPSILVKLAEESEQSSDE